MQLELFSAVTSAFVTSPGKVTTKGLYRAVAERVPIDLESKDPIGIAKVQRNTAERSVRWIQQTMKQLGLVEKMPGERGSWRLTAHGKNALCPATRGHVLIACRTDLGIALWSNYEDVYKHLDEQISLVLTSPPYALAKARSYGGPDKNTYTDFICEAMEPMVRNLAPGGSIVLNVTNDSFEKNSPARSLYRERLVIALFERLGLSKMDELIWENPCKPPGPTYWSSVNRYHLTSTWEPLLWFTNDPHSIAADNRRVLVPHAAAQRRLIERGGDGRRCSYGDGAYRLRPHSFSGETPGTIPRNILRFPHNCPEKAKLAMAARSAGIPVHGATMPQALAEFLVRYLSKTGDLVVDPFAGWLTTAAAAEKHGRRWLVAERMAVYAHVAIERFRHASGFVAGEGFGLGYSSVNGITSERNTDGLTKY